MSPREAVHYSGNPSGGSLHVIRPTRPRKAWAAIQEFLNQVESVQGPSDIALNVFRATSRDDAAKADACLAQTIERFGPSAGINFRVVPMETGVPEGEGHEWPVPAARFAEFRDYVIAGDPWHKQVLGPVALNFRYSFQWRDPDGSGPLDEQLAGNCTTDGQLRSEIRITLARRTHSSPWLMFPYAHDDPRLVDLLSFITQILPVKLAARNFRRAIPEKSGARYFLRKFDARNLVGG